MRTDADRARRTGRASRSSAALVVFGATGDLAVAQALPGARAGSPSATSCRARFAVVGVARTEMSDEDFAARVPELAARGRHVPLRRRARSTTADTFIAARARRSRTATSGTAPPGTASTTCRRCRTAFATVARGLGAVGLAEEPPGHVPPPRHREAVRARPRERRASSTTQLHAVFARAPDLPDRPLPGQGDGAEHPGAAVRQHDLRAAVEPPLRRPRARSPWPSRSASSTGARSTSRPGALRDIVQNHVLQVLALTAMEPPASLRGRRRSATRR